MLVFYMLKMLQILSLQTHPYFKCFFFKILFIYLRHRERERERASERAQAWGVAEGEAASLLSRAPDVGLDPRTPGSWPEPKTDV